MGQSNTTSIILLLVLAMTFTIGCDMLGCSSTDKSSNGAGEGSSTATENENSDDAELAIEIDENDADKSSDEPSGPVKSTNSDRTIVKFGKGKTSAGYEDAVVRGNKHTYILGASQGQDMSVSINSLENNAGFYILSPKEFLIGDGTMEDGVTRFNGTLPESGNYKIIVTPSRGNATYKINFGVSAKQTTPPPSSGSRTFTVKFRKGGTSASYSNAVVRGDRDTYVLGAGGGQMMSVSISSPENNAAFDVIAPGGNTLATERTSWSSQLPSDGNYRIVVGGTRGNATYRVNFSIR